MQINVSQLLKEPIGSTRTHEVNDIAELAGNNSRVQGEVGLIRTDRGILAQGTLRTQVDLTCGRCLSQFACPLSVSIEDEYFPTADVSSGAQLPLPDESGYFKIDEHHIIDLTEATRQYVDLAIPMKPLCGEGCAGLCPTCGHNLNQGPCNCPPQGIDPRWAKLNTLASANSDVSANNQQGRE